MNVPSLIPFVVGLIGFESCLKDSSDIWKYGPEYTFDAIVNSSMVMPRDNHSLGSFVTFSLKCRPFYSTPIENKTNGLQCYIDNAQITNYKVFKKGTSMTSAQDNQTAAFDIGDRKFEIIYDGNGIEEFRIEQQISLWRLNMFRAVANQLNIGFNKFDKGGEQFAVGEVVGPENSIIGSCETKYEVSKQMTDIRRHWNSSKCENKFHSETYAYGNANPMITLNKTRDINKCSKSTPYAFGAHTIAIDKLSGINMKMMSSVTTFFVGPQSFQSRTKNVATENLNGTVLGPSEENIDLTLKSIEPAQSEFQRISTPGITKIFANDPVHYSE